MNSGKTTFSASADFNSSDYLKTDSARAASLSEKEAHTAATVLFVAAMDRGKLAP